MFFCKKPCEEGNILIETTEFRAQRGRYSIEFNEGKLGKDHIVYVTITGLKKSDSGWYRCGIERVLFRDSHQDFQIIVQEGDLNLQTLFSLPLSFWKKTN